jgi:hypothetical protein
MDEMHFDSKRAQAQKIIQQKKHKKKNEERRIYNGWL